MTILKKNVFISYSHQDKKWLERLKVYLKPLKDNYKIIFGADTEKHSYEIKLWEDTEIKPGTDWAKQIKEFIKSADIAILLVSEYFFASDFIVKKEIPLLLEEKKRRELKIISLIIRPSRFEKSILYNYQAINKPSEPLISLDESDQCTVLLELTNEIESALNIPSPRIEISEEERNESKVLIFDIDGTVLDKDEDFSNKGNLLDIFTELINNGFYIVFITGNDYNRQKPRVLIPAIQKQLASSITCFSDGGSRVFDFNSGDFIEDLEYSQNHIINNQEIQEIQVIFSSSLEEFIKENPDLNFPDISFYRQDKKHLDFLIGPIQKTFFNNSYEILTNDIKAVLKDLDIKSDCYVLDSSIPNSVAIRLSGGKYVIYDSFEVQSRLQALFRLKEMYKGMSKPEMLKRGGSNHICQIALKPFKLKKLRACFLDKLKSKFNEHSLLNEKFILLLGGKTTIDIQYRNVNKATAVMHLIDKKNFIPEKIVYFGDEFNRGGNDYPILEMKKSFRPKIIVNVGELDEYSQNNKKIEGFLQDGNGPEGTFNFLKFLNNQCS